MPFIGKQPQAGAYSKLDAITTSATATYNLTLSGSAYYPSSANHLLVSLNGVLQAPQDSFTVSGSQITFASALTSSDSIDFIMALGDVLDIGTPSAGATVPGAFNVQDNFAVGGNTTVTGTLTSTGKITSTAGITFGSDTASSNVLDDYEEGSWTPLLQNSSDEAFTGTYYYQWGRYIKVGKLVTVWCYAYTTDDVSTTGGNGFTINDDIEITGVPFNVIGNVAGRGAGDTQFNSSDQQYAGTVDGLEWTQGGYHAAVPFLRATDNIIRIRLTGSGQSSLNLNVNSIDVCSMKITFSYETDQ
jgi:hypothetical protein